MMEPSMFSLLSFLLEQIPIRISSQLIHQALRWHHDAKLKNNSQFSSQMTSDMVEDIFLEMPSPYSFQDDSFFVFLLLNSSNIIKVYWTKKTCLHSSFIFLVVHSYFFWWNVSYLPPGITSSWCFDFVFMYTKSQGDRSQPPWISPFSGWHVHLYLQPRHLPEFQTHISDGFLKILPGHPIFIGNFRI